VLDAVADVGGREAFDLGQHGCLDRARVGAAIFDHPARHRVAPIDGGDDRVVKAAHAALGGIEQIADGEHRADFFDKNRLQAVMLVDGQPVEKAPDIIRRGPGVWFFTWQPPAGLGGSRATFGATFDGVAIVSPRSVAIASDSWNARYPSRSGGSRCSVTSTVAGTGPATGAWLGAAALIITCARRRKTCSS